MSDKNFLELLKFEDKKNPYYICETYCDYFYKVKDRDGGYCLFPADECFIRDGDYKNINKKNF